MPQTFQVLRCYKCKVFQVHQTKKSIKWECKLCGEKQSIKRHYGIGTGKDCRLHVQKLNNIRGEIDELKCSQMRKNAESDEESETQPFKPEPINPQPKLTEESKWTNYIEKIEGSEETSNDPMRFGDAEVVLEIPTKRKKQLHNYSRSHYSKSRKLITTAKGYIQQDSETSKKGDETLYKSSVDNTSQDIVLTSDSMTKMDKENYKPNAPVKKFVPPLLNKNSKWAQLADEESDVTPSQCLEPSQTGLFALCDDSELDNVLDCSF